MCVVKKCVNPIQTRNSDMHLYPPYSWPMTFTKQLPRTMVWASLPLQLSNTSVQLVWRESVKQLNTTPLNSSKRGESWQRPCTEIIIIIIYPLTARVVEARQMISQPVSSIFPDTAREKRLWLLKKKKISLFFKTFFSSPFWFDCCHLVLWARHGILQLSPPFFFTVEQNNDFPGCWSCSASSRFSSELVRCIWTVFLPSYVIRWTCSATLLVIDSSRERDVLSSSVVAFGYFERIDYFSWLLCMVRKIGPLYTAVRVVKSPAFSSRLWNRSVRRLLL